MSITEHWFAKMGPPMALWMMIVNSLTSQFFRSRCSVSLLPRVLLCTMSMALLSCKNAPPDPPEQSDQLLIAAASNLSEAFQQIGDDFKKQTGIVIQFNFGATAQLAQQIEHGAAFDLFAAADVSHVDMLVRDGKLLPESRAIYARGKLALWVPPGSRSNISSLRDLENNSVRFIAIANPEVAPYGAAAEQLLRSYSLWDQLEPKLVRAENVTAAKQMAATGNADAAFTAYSLVFREQGTIIPLDGAGLAPIDQALGILTSSAQQQNAARFAEFVLRGPGREILRASGYDPP